MKIALLGGNNLEKLSATADAVRKYSDCLVIPGDLTDMAFLSGAVSQAAEYFGKIFKKNYGVSPLAYRNKNSEKQEGSVE